MTKEQKCKLMAYIDALERVNEQLVIAVKECVELLSKYPPPGKNPRDWKKKGRGNELARAHTESFSDLKA